MNVTFSPIFNRKKQLNQHGKAPVEIRVYQNRKRRFLGTGVLITPQQWDEKKLEVKRHPLADELNERIRAAMRDLETLRLKHKVVGKNFSINSVSNAEDKNNTLSFIAFIKSEIARNRTLSEKTKISHQNLINKLNEYRENKDILFGEIDYSFVDDFLNYLRSQDYAMNTIHKHHKNLKKYIELAIKKDFYTQKNPCKEIRVRYEQKKREVLTWEEVKTIEELDLSKYDQKVSVVRDMFLFSFYTGLRISDVTNLKTEYIKKNKDGYALDFLTIKVNKRAEIPLYSLFKSLGTKLSKPETILEKYFQKENDFLFPRLTEQFINRHLKLLASEASILVSFTFHTARHTFGTYMAGKIPLPQLMYLMQHSDIKTTMIYVNTSQELVKQGLLKVEWE